MQNIKFFAELAWQRYCVLYPKLEQFKMPEVVLNTRLIKTAGYNNCNNNLIVLNSRMLKKYPKNMLQVILPHEMAHQVDFNLNGWPKYKRHHGRQWQDIMISYGLNPDPYHTMEL